jgi:hypothetical protein
VPSFCRHNRLIQNCPICSREQAVEMRPLLTPSGPREVVRGSSPSGPARARSASTRRASGSAGGPGVRVRRLARGSDDGYRSPRVPGLRSSEDATRLAEEIAFSAHRLTALEREPPGLYAEVAGGSSDIEERTWLAFLIAYLCPVEDDAPFSPIAAARAGWSSGELPDLAGVLTGPRSVHDPARGGRTLEAYRAWARRAGSQATAFNGESIWTPERRFARVFERLSLPGLHRDARFDLLVTLGRLGVYPLRGGSLALGGDNQVTVAAKRALGIGDPILLERRAGELALACKVPLEALDLGLYNWERGKRATMGLGQDAEPPAEAVERVERALGL